MMAEAIVAAIAFALLVLGNELPPQAQLPSTSYASPVVCEGQYHPDHGTNFGACR
jgi:hypothetical protein